MDKMAIIRSMNTKDVDHGQGTYLLHTGYLPRGPIKYPSLGSMVAKEVGTDESPLPNLRQHRSVPAIQPATSTAPASSARSTLR